MSEILENGAVLLDKYRIEEKLGEGATSVVYKALDTMIKKNVVIKILRPELAYDPEEKHRFLEEAKAATRVIHPGIVPIREINDTKDHLFIVMDYFSGVTLKSFMESKGVLSVKDAARITIKLLSILTHIHDAGLVHKDIKPSNILISEKGSELSLQLLDFGLATLNSKYRGQVIGSILYMSPEQAVGDPLDQRSDIYSVGVCLYKMLTNRFPIEEGNSIHEFIKKLIMNNPKPPSSYRRSIPSSIDKVTLQALDKDRRLRYNNARDLALKLETCIRYKEFLNRPRILFITPILLACIFLFFWGKAQINYRNEIYQASYALANKKFADAQNILENILKDHESLEAKKLWSRLMLSRLQDIDNDFDAALLCLNNAGKWSDTPEAIDEIRNHILFHQAINRAWDNAQKGEHEKGVQVLENIRSKRIFLHIIFSEIVKLTAEGKIEDATKFYKDGRFGPAIEALEEARKAGAYSFEIESLRQKINYKESLALYRKSMDQRNILQAKEEALRLLSFSQDKNSDRKYLEAVEKIISSSSVEVKILSPSPNALLDSRVVVVKGTATSGIKWIQVNGVEASFDKEFQSWETKITLPEGEGREILVIGSNHYGRVWEVSRFKVDIDVSSPEIEVTEKRFDPFKSVILVKGTASDSHKIVKVLVNGKDARPGQDGFRTWTAELPIKQGETKIEVIAIDRAGHESKTYAVLNLDTESPILKVLKPQTNEKIYDPWIEVSGEAEDISGIKEIRVAGQNAFPVNKDKGFEKWSANIPVSSLEGQGVMRRVPVVAEDYVGNKTVINDLWVSIEYLRWEATKKVATFFVHKGTVWGLAYSSKGDTLAVAANDGNISIWNVASESLSEITKGSYAGSFTIKVVPGVRIVGYILYELGTYPENAFSAAWRGGGCWEVPRSSIQTNNFSVIEVTGEREPLCVAYHPKGMYIAAGYPSGALRLWDRDGKLLWYNREHIGDVYCAAFSPSGDTLASSSGDATIKIWSIQEGSVIRTLKGHSMGVTSIIFSPEGDILFSGSRDHTVRLWSVPTGREIKLLQSGHTEPVYTVAMSPDGTTMASGGSNGKVILWKIGPK